MLLMIDNYDSFVFNLNGTNMLRLETEFMPLGMPIPSGSIDVTEWKGQEVELEFGVTGGTSTNASVTVKHLHFNTLAAPSISIASVGNSAVVSWPISAVDYSPESVSSLEPANTWTSITNGIGVDGYTYTLTNTVNDASHFYRLRRN